MAQEYIVSKAFQGKDKDTGEPEVVQTKGGGMHKFLVQVENQPVQGWMNILKKPGGEVKVGDVLYGDIVENNWGKPQFNRAQRPDGNYGGGQPARPQQQSQPSGSVEKKLDYIISLLENFLNSQGGAQREADFVPTDIDDGPVDLSQIDY